MGASLQYTSRGGTRRSPTPRSKPCAHNFTPRLSPSICVAPRRPDARPGRRGSEICWSRELSYQKMTRDWNHLRRRAAILQRLAARAFEVVSSAAAGRELQRSTSVFYLYRFRLLLDGNLSNGDVLTRQTLRGCPDVELARGPPSRRPRRSGKPVNDSTPFVVGHSHTNQRSPHEQTPDSDSGNVFRNVDGNSPNSELSMSKSIARTKQ